MPDWVTGLTHCDGVYTLSLKELRKTKSPGNKTVDDLAHLILHEFTHACTNQYVDYNKKCMWLSEGIACNLSHQYDSSKYNFKATEDEVLNGPTGYDNYSIMFAHALDKYGRDYILNLIKNPDLFEEETHRIFTEVTKQKSTYKCFLLSSFNSLTNLSSNSFASFSKLFIVPSSNISVSVRLHK